MSPRLFFEYSTWFFVVCLLVGLGYAMILYYKKKSPWDERVNRMLAAFRFILVSLLAGLLVSPFLRLTKNVYEKPLVVFAIDNSESIKLVMDSSVLDENINDINRMMVQLSEGGYETRVRTLNQYNSGGDVVNFSWGETDLSGMLKGIENDFEGLNLSTVVLFSDGIYTKGISPTYSSYSYQVNTIGIGDTIRKEDLIIKNVLYNKLSYLGNKFPVIVEILNEGFVDEKCIVTISKDGKQLDNKQINFTLNNQIRSVEFVMEALNVGLQRYTINLERKSNEFTYTNNRRHVFIDVIDGKENILIIAPAPHPDIKAMISAISSNENYETLTYIPGLNELPGNLEEMGLVIFHNIPDYKRTLGSLPDQIRDLNIPILYVVGSMTNITTLNKSMAPVNISLIRNEGDQVTAALNSHFGFFGLSEELKDFITQLPPVRAPFGNVAYDGQSGILLYQKIGSIVSNRPLLLFRNDGQIKTGLLLGEGIWRWKLQDYAENKSEDRFNELLLKTVQYLTTRDDKRKFRAYPRKNEFHENEPVVIQAEAYNTLYEPVYGIKVDIVLTDESGSAASYTFVTSENNSSFEMHDLSAGIYKYSATAIVNDKLSIVFGEYVVEQVNVESINLTADHHLLKDISRKSGGKYYGTGEMSILLDDLLQNKPPEIIHSTEEFRPLINLQWAFFLLLTLISLEWFTRKYQGGY